MRCTTCGEYIYKGRKFNARKEDVDDMNYLGLRIYRFYIKCTACVSEICFRTDPENTDYVLESGATRNFEALHKAQELAEKEDRAYKEELANNPMKLLEERTQASKNEMELVEALEELRELNKRTVSVDYNTMLEKYENERQAAVDAEEAADEEFVKAVFSKEGGVKMKRIVEEDSSSEEEKVKSKVAKTTTSFTAATDILTSGVEDKKEIEKKVWEKSIGTISSKKSLGSLVKKKTLPTFATPKTPIATPTTPVATPKAPVATTSSPVVAAPATNTAAAPTTSNALGLLGAYSGSDSQSE